MNTTVKTPKTLADIAAYVADSTFERNYPTQRPLCQAAREALAAHWKEQPGMPALARFGREVLSIMASSEAWDSDTTQAIGDMAHQMELWTVDSHDGSYMLNEKLPEIPAPEFNKRERAALLVGVAMLRSDSNEGHAERSPDGIDPPFTDAELDALCERLKV